MLRHSCARQLYSTRWIDLYCRGHNCSDTGSYSLVVKRFLEVDYSFDIGLPSSAFHVYKCGNISTDTRVINVDQVIFKGYRMPLFEQSSSDDSSSEDEDMESSKYIVAALIHME